MTLPRQIIYIGIILLMPMAIFGKEDSNLIEVQNLPAERLVLVTFPDRSLNHVFVGGPGRGYRRRGTYGSSTWAKNVSRKLAADYQLEVASQWPITELGEHCAVLLVPPQQSLQKVIATLDRDDRVAEVQSMNVFQTQNLPHDDPYYPLQDNLRLMKVDTAHTFATGRKINIAIIDTGVDLKHPDLKSRITWHKNFIHTRTTTFNEEIHGTAVAGIIAAQADQQGIVGVAPDVTLWPIRACWSAESGDLAARCSSLSLALALNSAIQLKPHIINLSLTGPKDPLLRRLIRIALDKGIVVVAAKPEKSGPNVGFPANMDRVITACLPQQLAPSEKGQDRCLAAPGHNILTTFPGDTYNFLSGSSASTAQISGIVALLLELDPKLSTDEIQDILRRSYNGQSLSVVDVSFAMELMKQTN